MTRYPQQLASRKRGSRVHLGGTASRRALYLTDGEGTSRARVGRAGGRFKRGNCTQ